MKKNSSKKFKFTKIYFVFIMFFIIACSIYLFNQYTILKAHQEHIMELKKEIGEQQKLNTELQKQKEYKNSDEYIEKIAREKLGMVKSDEIIFYDSNK